jgi:DNA-binding transcriptional LysR family regulator
MEIRDLEYLVASADARNFGRAAEALGLNISTISRRIALLEDELGLALFERGHSGVRLTAGGKSVMVHVRRALAALESLRRSGMQNGSGDVGEIRLGVRHPPIGEPLASLFRRWREGHANVALTISEMNDRDLAAALEERRLDLALTSHHAVRPRTATMPLFRDRIVVALPLGHTLAQRPTVAWDDFRHETILVPEWDNSPALLEFYATLQGQGATLRSHCASRQSLIALVAAGFGIALTTAGQSEVMLPGVVFKTIEGEDAQIQIVLAWLPELEDAAVGRFVAFLRDEAHARDLL